MSVLRELGHADRCAKEIGRHFRESGCGGVHDKPAPSLEVSKQDDAISPRRVAPPSPGRSWGRIARHTPARSGATEIESERDDNHRNSSPHRGIVDRSRHRIERAPRPFPSATSRSIAAFSHVPGECRQRPASVTARQRSRAPLRAANADRRLIARDVTGRISRFVSESASERRAHQVAGRQRRERLRVTTENHAAASTLDASRQPLERRRQRFTCGRMLEHRPGESRTESHSLRRAPAPPPG